MKSGQNIIHVRVVKMKWITKVTLWMAQSNYDGDLLDIECRLSFFPRTHELCSQEILKVTWNQMEYELTFILIHYVLGTHSLHHPVCCFHFVIAPTPHSPHYYILCIRYTFSYKCIAFYSPIPSLISYFNVIMIYAIMRIS